MPITLELLTSPIGSQFTSTIGADDPDDQNDFQVLILTSDNGTGLTESDITLSSGTLVSLTGKGASWEATLRPPETDEVITLTVAADAFTEGNVETEKDIRVSTSFPDTDAEVPTELFAHSLGSGTSVLGITIAPTGIKIRTRESLGDLRDIIESFDFTGTALGTETIPSSNARNEERKGFDYINGDYLINNRGGSVRINGQDLSFEQLMTGSTYLIGHSRYGIIGTYGTGFNSLFLRIESYETPRTQNDFDDVFIGFTSDPDLALAVQDDLVYSLTLSESVYRLNSFTEIEELGGFNVEKVSTQLDLAIYRDTLYVLSTTHVYSLDIRPYRPIAKNTKTTIYPVFANEGDTIDLTQFSPDAERIVPDVGFDKPDYLTFNTSNELEIDADAVTETHPVYIPLKAINRIDATDTGSFGFYLVIQQATDPIWREFDDLSMPADSAFNLFDVVKGADSITGTTLPTGASVSNGRLMIGAQGGTVVVRATNASGNTNHTFIVNVVQAGDPDNYSNEFRYRVQIANIDVTSDLKVSPSVSESLDAVILNETVLDEVSFTLRNDVQNGFRFSDTTPNNFWVENSLTEGGYRVGVKIFVESLVSGSIVQSLLFVGVIFDSVVSIDNADIVFTIVDLSYTFDRRSVEGLGQLTKWDALRQATDEASFEGAYTPEAAVTPMQVRTGQAWSDRSPITISDLGLPREGPALANTGHLTPTNFNVSGGFFATPPLLEFKPERRSEDVPYLIQQLGINGAIFNSHVMLSDREADMPFILNRGSVPFSVENTRSTRLLVGWVHDPTNDCVLMLLSNPEAHIADVLVQYDVADDFHRITQTFDKAIKTHRITRRNANNYYILTSAPITQDRSAADVPRTV